jgi:hypothetical protein
MKKTARLQISRTTVRSLDNAALQGAGGAPTIQEPSENVFCTRHNGLCNGSNGSPVCCSKTLRTQLTIDCEFHP